MNIAVIFAGGSGIRMGADVPKQFLEIDGRPILSRTLEIFERHSEIKWIYLVCNPKYREKTEEVVRRAACTKVRRIVDGGASAQDSIYNGLKAAAEDCSAETTVLIHDGVRPCVDDDVISANIASVSKYGNAVTYTPCVETLIISKNGNGVDDIPLRRESFSAQAPQSFHLGDIIAAHEKIRAMPEGYTDMVDQATICWRLGIKINLVPGNRGNIKITTVEDIYMMSAIFEYRKGLL